MFGAIRHSTSREVQSCKWQIPPWWPAEVEENRQLALVKCLSRNANTRTSGPVSEDYSCGVHIFSVSCKHKPPPCRDHSLHQHLPPRHHHPPPARRAHHRDPPTRSSHCSRIVTTTVLARPATILGPHAFAPASALPTRAQSPRLGKHQSVKEKGRNKLKSIDQ